MRTRLVFSLVACVLSLAVASPAVAAPPSIDDQTFTVSREDALQAYEEFGDIFLDCGEFVVSRGLHRQAAGYHLRGSRTSADFVHR